MASSTGTGQGSSKFAAAVDKARGKESGPTPEEVALATLSTEAKAMISTPTEEELNKFKNEPGYDFAPQVFSMEEGQMIAGVLEGMGPPTTFTGRDSSGKEITRIVNTWIIKHPKNGLRVSILSSIQLDKKLPPFVGDFVKIHRQKNIPTRSGFRVADYLVGGPPVSGKSRSWTYQPVIDVTGHAIDAPMEAPQLGSGSNGDSTVTDGEDAHA